MDLFLQVLKLVGEPPGSYAYHLVLLFALEAAAAIALSRAWVRRDAVRVRLTLAAMAIFGLRLIPLAASLAASFGLFDPRLILPPLDRAVSALTLLILIWAFAFPENKALADALSAGLVLLTLLALAVSLPLWAQSLGQGTAFYNGSLQDSIWAYAQVAFIALGGILLMVRRKSDWLTGLGLLLFLLIGQLLHLFRPVDRGNLANAVRLAEIVALPLFTAMVYRRAHAEEPAPAAAHEIGEAPTQPTLPTPEPGRETTPPAPKLGLDPKAAVALASLSAAASPEEAGQVLTLALAQTLRADLCLLITPPDTSGVAAVAVGYDLIREQTLSGGSLPLSEVPEVAAALYQGKIVQLAPDQHRLQLRRLVNLVGVDHVGPTVVFPLLTENNPLLAAIAVISAYSQRNWTPDDRRLIEALIEPIANTLAQVEKAAQISHDNEQQQAQAEAARAEAERLTGELSAAQAEADQLRIELEHTREEMEQQREEAEALTREIRAQQESEARQSALAMEMDQLRTSLQQAQQEAEARDRLEAELNAALERVEALAALESKLAALGQEAETHQQRWQESEAQRAQLEARLEAAAREAEAHQQRAQELAAELERARAGAKPTGSAAASVAGLSSIAELERLQTELETARRQAGERARLEDELKDALENFRTQASIAADLQMEITGYKQVEMQLRKELDLTRAELKRYTDRGLPFGEPLEEDDQALAGLQAALAAAQVELERKANALAEAREQIDRKERQLAKTQAALNALSSQTQPLDELKQRLAAKERELAEALDSLTALKGQNDALGAVQQQLAEAQTALTDQEQQLVEAQRRIAALREQADEVGRLRGQLEEKDRQLLKAQSALTTMSRQTGPLGRSQAQLVEAQAALAEQSSTLARVQAQLSEKEQQLAALAGQVEALPHLQAQLAETQAAFSQLRAQLAEKERQLQAAQSAPEPSAETEAPALQPSPPTAPFSAPPYEVIISLIQELRQPLSSIVGYSDLLLGESVGILGALQQKFLERIVASCERMEGLLDDLIRVAALDSGRLKLAHDSLDAMSVIEEAILGCGAQFREKSINLRMDIADNLPAILADRDAVRQIVSHLLNNAASASAMDGEVTLSVRPQSANGQSQNGLLISVRDSGGGIAPEDQSRVFSRKYRADAPLIAGLGDTAGMGLFIAKALTEAQGGRIWLTSEMGQGSTFSVLLPTAEAYAKGNGSSPG
jgi:signal transduction histidine kinase